MYNMAITRSQTKKNKVIPALSKILDRPFISHNRRLRDLTEFFTILNDAIPLIQTLPKFRDTTKMKAQELWREIFKYKRVVVWEDACNLFDIIRTYYVNMGWDPNDLQPSPSALLYWPSEN